ncbi:Alpha/Beta hydrolase protein [Entophlyctis helioformis]|nr:Alpha/Beta hydrolase protein [Entophlyctis helioformis]
MKFSSLVLAAVAIAAPVLAAPAAGTHSAADLEALYAQQLGASLELQQAIYTNATPATIKAVESATSSDINTIGVLAKRSAADADNDETLVKRADTAVDRATIERFKTFTQYASAAYCPSVVSNWGWNCGSSCEGRTADTVVEKSFDNFFGPGTAGAVTYNQRTKQIVVVFRGSVSVNNWLQNFMIWLQSPDFNDMADSTIPKTFNGRKVRVHKGFQEALQVVFTGHSLGGALASIAALDFYDINGAAGAAKLTLATLGQPRVGNEAFANYVNSLPFASRIFRLTANRDIVPELPPNLPGLEYVHFAQQYTVRDSGATVRCENDGGRGGETSGCYNPGLVSGVVDHIVGYYGIQTILRIC